MEYQREDGQTRLRRQRSKQAITLAMEGRWREAIEANKEIIESFPDDVEAHNRLGRAYMELGEYDQSREAYSRSLELDPYNNIAKKNLRRLSYLSETAVSAEGDSDKVDPQQFIEEVGKAGVVSLHNLAPPEIRVKMVAGDRVYLKVDGATLTVENGRGEELGQVDSQHGRRLVKLMEGGNEYTAAVVSSTESAMSIIIREIYQHPSQVGKPSFPTKSMEGIRPYVSERLFRRGMEYEEEGVEESGYTIISDSGEVEVLADESSDDENATDEE